MRLRNSFWGKLSQVVDADPEAVIEAIRQEMLAAVSELCGADEYGLDHKVRYASDIQALWNLRPDLMHAIIKKHGTEVARIRLNVITNLFKKV
jgi:hypothetical protein